MALTESDIEQFIAALHEDPQLKDRVRNAILSDDFLALPGIVAQLGERVDQLGLRMDQLTARMDQLTARMNELAEEVRTLTEQMIRVNQRLDRIEGRLGNVEGRVFEVGYRQNLRSHLARHLRKAVQGAAGDVDALWDAYRSARITPEDWSEIHRLDVLARGEDVNNPGHEKWLAIELSSVVDTGDVERAANRAALLRKFGLEVEAAVDGEQVLEDALLRAQDLGVTVLVERTAAA
jgi:outer membrane murein-binding lipoprotein Lpp